MDVVHEDKVARGEPLDTGDTSGDVVRAEEWNKLLLALENEQQPIQGYGPAPGDKTGLKSLLSKAVRPEIVTSLRNRTSVEDMISIHKLTPADLIQNQITLEMWITLDYLLEDLVVQLQCTWMQLLAMQLNYQIWRRYSKQLHMPTLVQVTKVCLITLSNWHLSIRYTPSALRTCSRTFARKTSCRSCSWVSA